MGDRHPVRRDGRRPLARPWVTGVPVLLRRSLTGCRVRNPLTSLQATSRTCDAKYRRGSPRSVVEPLGRPIRSPSCTFAHGPSGVQPAARLAHRAAGGPYKGSDDRPAVRAMRGAGPRIREPTAKHRGGERPLRVHHRRPPTVRGDRGEAGIRISRCDNSGLRPTRHATRGPTPGGSTRARARGVTLRCSGEAIPHEARSRRARP